MKVNHPPSSPESIVTFLSIDLLVQILDHIAGAGDRKSFRLVCRLFRRAESLHRRFLRPLRLEALPVLLGCRYQSVDSIDLSVCPSLDDASLAAVISGGGDWWRLRRVGFSRAGGIGWRGIDALVAACPSLEALDLSHCFQVSDREAAALAKAVGLRELRMDKCLGMTDFGLARVAVGCLKLERLAIKWCIKISDVGIDLLAKKCRDLRVLDISYLKVKNKSLRSISSLEKIETLALVGCRFIDDNGLAFLNNGRNSLQSIDISRCEKVTWSGIASVIEGHRNLQMINMGDCRTVVVPAFPSHLGSIKATLTRLKLDGLEVSDVSLQNIGANCKNLLEIGLSKCHSLSDEGIRGLVPSCTGMRSIDLTCCHLLTDNALATIAKYCSHLTCLRLEACSLLTENGFGQIVTGCPQLQEIDLTDCNISDSALQHLSNCSELKVLKLGLCTKVTSKGLAHIGSNCRNLEELDLYRCAVVDDYGLSFLADGCKKLRKLNLCYCIRITDQGIMLLSCMEELSDLELRGLDNVSAMGITSIAIGCKSLVELDLKHCSSIDDASLFALTLHSQKLRQINISNCPVSKLGLCKILASSCCLQDVKMVQLNLVNVEGFEFALRASRGKLKKLKLVGGLRKLLSPGLLHMLQAKGCRIRWVDKPVVFSSCGSTPSRLYEI